MKLLISLFIFLSVFSTKICPQYSLTGIVTDSLTGKAVNRSKISAGDSIYFTGINGRFLVNFINPGKYLIKILHENYINKDTLIILSDSVYNIDLQLKLVKKEPHTDTIDVSDFFNKKAPDISTSFLNSKYEEIRKNPGSFEDVIKYYTAVQGVISGNDTYNQLLVRGGSSFENMVLLDGFEIPNPNHYGPPGSSNGALSFVNSKLIGEVDFYTGGLPARFGDKISSVMDIKYREGSRKQHIRDLNLSVTGYGGFFEGPLTHNGSYMFAARKSYFELIKEQLTTSLLPDYWDFNGKLCYDISKTGKISFSGSYVIDHAEAYKYSSNYDDTVDMKLFNGSIKFTNNPGDALISSVAGYSSSVYDAKYILYDLNISDRYFSFTQNFSLKLKIFDADLTSGLKYYFSDYRVHHSDTYNESGYYVPELFTDTEVKTLKVYGGVNLRKTILSSRLIINAGLRMDYFEYMNDPYAFSPRLGLVYRISDKLSLAANAGIYYQAPELAWLVNYPQNRALSYIKCTQFVLGAEHFPGKTIKITLEGYLKQYNYYPVSVYDPNYIFLNNGVDLYPNFLDLAVSAGKGYYTGIDISAEQKNNGNGLFWSAGYSFSHSRFLALAGDYQPAEFDPRHQLNLTAGFKFPFGFSISGHFKYEGGKPYTPYDMEKSYFYKRGVFVENYYNKARLPEYIRLDLRVEQEMHPLNTDLTVYFEVLNVFNRKNLYEYGWDYRQNILWEYVQFYRIPAAGISWRF